MNALETNTHQHSKDTSASAESEFSGNAGKSMMPPAFSLVASTMSPASTGISVTFGAVRAANTPAGMTDRIPPRVPTPVTVEVEGWSSEMGEIEVTIENAGGPQGAASIDGRPSVQIGAGGTLQVLGSQQTAPGAGGQLFLVARHQGVVVGTGKPFSVAAIPQNWSCKYAGPLTDNERGFKENTDVESDSGVKEDLDQVLVKEKVERQEGTGVLEQVETETAKGFFSPLEGIDDKHGLKVYSAQGEGTMRTQQVFVFRDLRTGSGEHSIENSGFQIARDIILKAPASGKYWLTTEKYGHSGSAEGHSSNAGFANISLSQWV